MGASRSRIGYSHTRFDVRDRASSGQSNNYHVGLYGGTQWGALGFRGGATYTWHDISTARTLAFPGFGDSLRADYNAGTTQLFGEFGSRVDLGRLALEPFANLAYLNLRTGAFTEQGGVAALTAASTSSDAAFTTLGVRASTGFMLGATYATTRGTLGWRHAFGGTTPFSSFRRRQRLQHCGRADCAGGGRGQRRNRLRSHQGGDCRYFLWRPVRRQRRRPERSRTTDRPVLTKRVAAVRK